MVNIAESLCDQVSVRTQIAVKTAFHLSDLLFFIIFLVFSSNHSRNKKMYVNSAQTKTRLEPEKLKQHQLHSPI